MSAYDMSIENRAPSIDMTSIELRDMTSPAPAYSSTFHSEDVLSTFQHASFIASPKSGTANNLYYQPTKHWPLPSMPPSELKAPVKAEEEAQVKPDYQDPNHPHFAQSTRPGFPTTLPARSRMPQKRVLVPWVLFILFFLTTMWYTSILFGARFLSIIRPLPPTPPTPEINVYINGEVFKWSVSVPASTTVMHMSSPTSIPQAPRPTTSVPGSNGDALPDMSNDLARISTPHEKRIVVAPTAFITVTRGVL